MKIAIPSHKRADTLTTHRLVRDFVVCVPESQRDDYLAVTPHVVTHPDSIIGLTPKLNWMLANLADDEGIVFLDDDLDYLCRCYGTPAENADRKVTDPDLIEAIIAQTAQLAREAGAYFFGWESSAETIRYYSGHQPFAFRGFVNGCAMGFLHGHGLSFDERIVAKNDYDIACSNAFRHRILFKDSRFAWCQRETFTGAGGQACHRNSLTEQRDVQILREKYGDVIQTGAKGGTRKRDYAGAVKVTLRLPF